MPQGSSRLTSKRERGGRASQKHGSRMRKGAVAKKPKQAAIAAKLNESRRVTGAITRHIEKEVGEKVHRNGKSLSLLQSKPSNLRQNGVKSEADPRKSAKKATLSDAVPKFNPKKQFKL